MRKYFLTLGLITNIAVAQMLPSCPATSASKLAIQQSCLANQVQQGAASMKALIVSSALRQYNAVWKNKLLTPANAWAALVDPSSGTPFACKLHTAYIALSSFVNAQVSGSLPAEPCSVACNSDGTVTLSCPSP
jgi:hypothetical protein